MKKIIALILALVMIMSLAACSKKPTEAPADPEMVDPGNEPAAPGEGPEMDDMPAVSDSDLPMVDYPASDTDMPVVDYPASDSDLPVAEGVALDILNTVWGKYQPADKFAAMGGDYVNMVMDGPGACGLSDTEALDSLFGIPASAVANVASAASLLHAMNQNTFTSACYELMPGADAEAFAQELKDNILARQWMCGFPETLLIVDLGGCVVSAFGNAGLIENFKNILTESYEATVVVEEPIA